MGQIASTNYGQLEGRRDNGVVRFDGIPFARPPVGELRFRAPEKPEPWDGVRSAAAPGPACPQLPSPLDMLFGMEPEPTSEDCLYLNVVTPAVDDARRPVMVWIHGGGFIMGSGSSPMYDGASFCRRGDVVYVSLNYRLGELGFLHLDEVDRAYRGSADNGLLDQIAALEWVRDNIGRFGGDPDNVTIFGESAGGMSVSMLLAAPAARGLFHRAIAQSGAARNVISSEVAAQIAQDYLARLGVSTVDELVALPVERLLSARGDLMMSAMGAVDDVVSGKGPLLGLPFQPVTGGAVLPADPVGAIASGSAAGVPLLVGTTRDEWKLFGFLAFGDVDDERLLERARLLLSGAGSSTAPADLVAAYRADATEASAADLFGEIANDYAFRIPAIRLAETQQRVDPAVWMYLFDWKSRAMGGALGACHGMELPFVFHNVAEPRMALFLGEGPTPTALADEIQDAWLAFARNGDPRVPGSPAPTAWEPYDPSGRATMVFGEPSRVEADPMAAHRALWDTIL